MDHLRINLMTASVTSETRTRLAPLKCVNCNAPLVVVNRPSLVCRFCGAVNFVSSEYREELRLARDLDSTTREAAREWLRLAHIKVSRRRLICGVLAPFVLISGGGGGFFFSGVGGGGE